MYQILLSPYINVFYTKWKLAPNRSDHNVVFSQEFEDEIDILKLNKAIKRFISDYVILNSHIKKQNEELYWVKNHKVYELEYLKSKLIDKDILLYVQKPFNLESGPLYRFGLIKNHNNKLEMALNYYKFHCLKDL